MRRRLTLKQHLEDAELRVQRAQRRLDRHPGARIDTQATSDSGAALASVNIFSVRIIAA